MAKTYRATVQRDGKSWLVRVDGVGATQARHLRELDIMTTDLVAVMKDVDPAEVHVDYEFVLPVSVREHLERAANLREQSARAQSDAAAELRAAVRELAD